MNHSMVAGGDCARQPIVRFCGIGVAAFAMGVLLLASCIPVAGQPGTGAMSTLMVAASSNASDIIEGGEATLTAEASDGTAPYFYRWDLNDGPAEVVFDDPTSQTISTGRLSEPGRYVFRVLVTDSGGESATDFVAIEVTRVLSASAPEIATVGDPAVLVATLDLEGAGASFVWSVLAGDATIAEPTLPNTTITTESAGTVEVQLEVTISVDGAEPTVTTRLFEIESVVELRPRVLVETNFGAFTIELNREAAPRHAENFLAYVDDGFYDGLLFHRLACTDLQAGEVCEPFVLQGGGYMRVADELEMVEPTREPIASEAGDATSNGVLYSVALALSADPLTFMTDPDSGTSQFFVNLTDNSFLDEQGFTAFGLIVEGTDVLESIIAMDRTDNPILTGEVSLPVEDVIIESISRIGT